MLNINYFQNDNSTCLSVDNINSHLLIKNISDNEKSEIDNSNLRFIQRQLFMHYDMENIEYDEDDPVWQNTSLYFWQAEEPFPKKSLPPMFEELTHKYFVFNTTINLESFLVTPWFDQPGLGEKYSAIVESKKTPLANLYESKIISYINHISDLTLDKLTNDDYYFLVDERIVTFKDNRLYLDEQIVPNHVAYIIGGIHLVRIN